jgi:hypothetical protein
MIQPQLDVYRIEIPKQSADIDVSQMTDEQIHAKLQRGYDDYKAGLTMDAATAFSKFRESH